jgi:hypothetical protein
VIVIFADHPDDRHRLLKMAESARFCGSYFGIVNPTVTQASAKGDLVVVTTPDLLVPLTEGFAKELSPTDDEGKMSGLGDDLGWRVLTVTANEENPFQFTSKDFGVFKENCGSRICDGMHSCTDPDKCLASGATKLAKFALQSEIQFRNGKKKCQVESTSFALIFGTLGFVSSTRNTILNNAGEMANLKNRLLDIKRAFLAGGGEIQFQVYEWHSSDLDGEVREKKRAKAVVSSIKWPVDDNGVYEGKKLTGTDMSPAASVAHFYKDVPMPSTAQPSTASLNAFLGVGRPTVNHADEIAQASGCIQPVKDQVEAAVAGCRDIMSMCNLCIFTRSTGSSVSVPQNQGK